MELTPKEKSYYQIMLYKNRLFPFIFNDRFIGFLTFYICSSNEHIQDPWEIREDSPLTGEVCYIMQLLTDKLSFNSKLSYSIWKIFKEYIQLTYSQVKIIKWVRWKNDKRYIFNKKLEKENCNV